MSLFSRETDDDESGGALKAALITSLIGAGVQFGVNAWQNWQNKRNWAATNAYNDPSQQVARYRNAGLSPNLIYGNGQSSAGNASTIAPYQSQGVGVQDFLSAANAVLSLKTMASQIRKTEGESLAAVAAAKGQELANQRTETENHYLDQSLALRNRLQALNVDLANGNIGLQSYQRKVLEAQASSLMENALYHKYKRESYDPAILGIKRIELSNATRLLSEQIQNYFTERELTKNRSKLLEKDYSWYNWTHGIGLGVDVLKGIGSVLGGFGLGKFIGGGRSGTRGSGRNLGGSVYMSPSYPEYGL